VHRDIDLDIFFKRKMKIRKARNYGIERAEGITFYH
jgi:hypothetical protein